MTNYEKEFNDLVRIFGYSGIYDVSNNEFLSEILTDLSTFKDRIILENPKIPSIDVFFIDNIGLNAIAFESDSKNHYIGITKGLIDALAKITDEVLLLVDLYFDNLFKKDLLEINRGMLVKHSIKFLFCHELSHIRYGHCGYKKSININFIAEMA